MTGGNRTRLLILAAAALVAAIASAVIREPEVRPASTPAAVKTEPAGATVAPPLPGPLRSEPPGLTAAARERRRARSFSRRFLRAFLAYQRGKVTGGVRSSLRENSTPALAHALLATPPRVPDRGSPRATLDWLSIFGPHQRKLKASALLSYEGAGKSLLELSLVQTPGGLRVAEVRP